MRVAYLSPMPPERSGIADFSAELLPQLAQRVDLDVFTSRPRMEMVPEGVTVRRYPSGGAAQHLAGYDVALYQVGNHGQYHDEIYDLAVRFPGLVVLHEYGIHDLVLQHALARGGQVRYQREMAWAYGESGRRAAEAAVRPDPYRYPLFERVVDSARGVLVHSESARRRILISRPRAEVSVVPLLVRPRPQIAVDRQEVLAQLRVPATSFTVGSFGWLTPAKQLGVVARAFLTLRQQVPEARLLFAGAIPRECELQIERLQQLDPEAIVVTGRLPLEQLLDLMAVIDVAVNLRHPTAGETSAACVRLLAEGRPTVVHNVGWFGEIPDGCCAKIERGPKEIDHLATILVELWRSPHLRDSLGRHARAWFLKRHSAERVVAGYVAALESAAAVTRERPATPVESESPAYGQQLLAELGRDMADLGIDEDDEAVAELTALVVDLGLRG